MPFGKDLYTISIQPDQISFCNWHVAVSPPLKIENYFLRLFICQITARVVTHQIIPPLVGRDPGSTLGAGRREGQLHPGHLEMLTQREEARVRSEDIHES